jgi:predicted Rossmann-fold nucleotide-binding protein
MQTLFDQHGLYKDYFLHVPASLETGSSSSQNTYELLSNVEAMMKDSDAAVLLPDASKKPAGAEPASLQELMKLYTLFSLEVARQLNSRDMDKPVFIMNHDGSWDNALAIHHDLTNSNMTKEYNISLPAMHANEAGKVRVRSTSYFDVLEGHDAKPVTFEDTQQVLLKLLGEKRKGYTRRHTNPDEVIEHGLTPDNDSTPDFKVAVFCSASSENDGLNRSVKQLSHDLVADDFGIIYGGGDRYTMGAVLDGVVQYRQELKAKSPELSDDYLKYKAWIAGYSTKQILKSETKLGKFSGELSYTKRTADIYQRMADMLEHCDAVVAAPGGAGTVQEWAAALILNKLHPDNAKPIVFYDPPLNREQHQVWSTSLRLLLGEKDYTLLTSDSTPAEQKLKRSQELGIYIEKSDESVKHRLLELRRERGHARSLEQGVDTGVQLH